MFSLWARAGLRDSRRADCTLVVTVSSRTNALVKCIARTAQDAQLRSQESTSQSARRDLYSRSSQSSVRPLYHRRSLTSTSPALTSDGTRNECAAQTTSGHTLGQDQRPSRRQEDTRKNQVRSNKNIGDTTRTPIDRSFFSPYLAGVEQRAQGSTQNKSRSHLATVVTPFDPDTLRLKNPGHEERAHKTEVTGQSMLEALWEEQETAEEHESNDLESPELDHRRDHSLGSRRVHKCSTRAYRVFKPQLHGDDGHTIDHETSDEEMRQLDYGTKLYMALQQGEADMTTRCLFAAYQANDMVFIGEISDDTFSDIIRLLSPNNFVEQLTTAHLELSEAMVKQLNIAPVNEVALEYSQVLTHIMKLRRAAGCKLNLADYRLLLRSARDLGDGELGYITWQALLRDEIIPDTACYNYYMASFVWNGMHQPSIRHRVRVVPFNRVVREQAYNSSYRGSPCSVLATARMIFDDMLKHGAIGDEESFRILIVAAARDGQVGAVKSILHKIWDVDVDALTSGADPSDLTPRALSPESPLYPSSKLLFALAHAFSINNDIPTALRVVDFFASKYQITITTEVWSHLFEWTFVLSLKRTGTSRSDGSKTGEMPPQTLLSLWDLMTGGTYGIKPTMGMYNQLIKNLFRGTQTPLMVEKMHGGLRLYRKNRDAARHAYRELRAGIARQERERREGKQGHGSQGMPLRAEDGTAKSLQQLRQQWEYLNLVRRRDVFWLKRWLRMLLTTFEEWHRSDWVDKTYAQGLPRLLWTWRMWAPTRVEYETPTAFVEFDIRQPDQIAALSTSRAERLAQEKRLLDRVPRFIGDNWTREV